MMNSDLKYSLFSWRENGRVEMLWIAHISSSNSLNLTLTPNVTEKHIVVTIIEHIYQSQPSSTDSLYLWWDFGRVEMLVSIAWIIPKTLSPGVGVKCRALELKSSPPITQKLGCGVGYTGWIQISNSILVWKVDYTMKTAFTPNVTEKHIVVTIIEHIYQSQPSLIIPYTYDAWVIRRVEMLVSIAWIIPKTPSHGVKCRALELKSSSPITQKSGCGVGCWLYMVNSDQT